MPVVIKFYPASSAIGYMFGAGARNLKAIGNRLNAARDGKGVTIKFNNPTEKAPGQFCIISNDPEKADAAYEDLRFLEDECINGRVEVAPDGTESRTGDWWGTAISKDTSDETVKYTHKLIKSIAGLVIGKNSANLIQARADHFEVDINVVNGEDGSCSITYEAKADNEAEAFRALQQLRRIERDTFAQSQTKCLDSRKRVERARISDGLETVDEKKMVTLEN